MRSKIPSVGDLTVLRESAEDLDSSESEQELQIQLEQVNRDSPFLNRNNSILNSFEAENTRRA